MRLTRSIVLISIALGLAGCGARSHTAAEHPGATPAVMSAADAHAYLADHPEALVLDVREPAEWNDDLGHIEGAKQIPLETLEARLAEIDAWKDKPVIVVCRSGERSERAVETLRAAGFKLAVNLEGGMSAWKGAGY